MTILLLLAAQALPTADLLAPASLRVLKSCEASTDTETIIVCGKRPDFRLPLPAEREVADPDARHPGDIPNGTSVLTPSGRCGIFPGERRCSRREAARYGYGGGRDPITLLTRLGTKVLDPDAD